MTDPRIRPSNVQASADKSASSPKPEQVRRCSLRRRAENRPESTPSADGGPLRSILLIEDNPADADLVRAALEEHGVEGELLLIDDGEEAVQYIHELDREPVDFPDMVIIDLNLPKRPGRDVLQAMGECVKGRGSIAVILSSSDAPRDRTESIGLGAIRYIRKPLGLEEFLNLGAVFKALLESAGESC